VGEVGGGSVATDAAQGSGLHTGVGPDRPH
jgi:hypothetical protein